MIGSQASVFFCRGSGFQGGRCSSFLGDRGYGLRGEKGSVRTATESRSQNDRGLEGLSGCVDRGRALGGGPDVAARGSSSFSGLVRGNTTTGSTANVPHIWWNVSNF